MADNPAKEKGAFRTIGEVARDLGVPQHILRYWETRFPQLKPLQRAGNRRYYRPEDVALVQRIDAWLNKEGYTIRGVQQLLGRRESTTVAETTPRATDVPGAEIKAVRDLLARALAEDGH